MMPRVIDDEVGRETWMPTDKIAIPIALSATLIFGYIGLGALFAS